MTRNLNFTKIWNPEISLKFRNFGPNFCVWPLNIKTKKCYIATWGQKWLLPWFLRGVLWGPPIGSNRIRYPMGGRVKLLFCLIWYCMVLIVLYSLFFIWYFIFYCMLFYACFKSSKNNIKVEVKCFLSRHFVTQSYLIKEKELNSWSAHGKNIDKWKLIKNLFVVYFN